MVGKTGEAIKDEAQFSLEEASVVLRAALVDHLGGNAELRAQAQAILLEKARDRGMEIDPKDLDYKTSQALEEIRDALTFVFELQLESEGHLYDGFADPKSREYELVITQVIKTYLLHKSVTEPEYQLKLDISRWSDEMDEINYSFVDYLREVNWQSYYESGTGPLSTVFLMNLSDLVDQLDGEARHVLEKIHEEATRKFRRERKEDYGRAWRSLNDRNWQTLVETLGAVTRRILEDARSRGNAETDEEYLGKLATAPYLSRDQIRYFSEEFESRFTE